MCVRTVSKYVLARAFERARRQWGHVSVCGLRGEGKKARPRRTPTGTTVPRPETSHASPGQASVRAYACVISDIASTSEPALALALRPTRNELWYYSIPRNVRREAAPAILRLSSCITHLASPAQSGPSPAPARSLRQPAAGAGFLSLGPLLLLPASAVFDRTPYVASILTDTYRTPASHRARPVPFTSHDNGN